MVSCGMRAVDARFGLQGSMHHYICLGFRVAARILSPAVEPVMGDKGVELNPFDEFFKRNIMRRFHSGLLKLKRDCTAVKFA